jgi:beta-glucosidase/6-phospho-beta-glucosidase/beta-galactosidase
MPLDRTWGEGVLTVGGSYPWCMTLAATRCEIPQSKGLPMVKAYRRHDDGIFPSFFMAGFECSTFLWKDGERKDYIVLTGHDKHLEEDYDLLCDLGLGTVREAVRWPLVDVGGGEYDWSSVQPFLEAAQRHHICPIWDLCHYGLPDGCDPFDDSCVERFAAYCRAAAEYLVPQTRAPRFFTPINEISFFAAGGTDMCWMYPFAKGKEYEFKKRLCKMAIEGAKAIRSVDPDARMVHVDPLVHHVAGEGTSDEEAEESLEDIWRAWDMLGGYLEPQLGGSTELLDIVGVNVYHFSQAEIKDDGSREVLGPRDERRKSLHELLEDAWSRYHHPIIIGETSGYGDKRGEWLRMTVEESLLALNHGIDLQGICLYPFVDMPDWQSGELAKIGLLDLDDLESCRRTPNEPYLHELRRWQKILDQPDHVDDDKGRVQLDEVRRYAKEWEDGKRDSPSVELW